MSHNSLPLHINSKEEVGDYQSGFFFSSRGKKCPSNGKDFMEVTSISVSSISRMFKSGLITKEEARAILKRAGLIE